MSTEALVDRDGSRFGSIYCDSGAVHLMLDASAILGVSRDICEEYIVGEFLEWLTTTEGPYPIEDLQFVSDANAVGAWARYLQARKDGWRPKSIRDRPEAEPAIADMNAPVYLTPAQAREMAAWLISHADEAEALAGPPPEDEASPDPSVPETTSSKENPEPGIPEALSAALGACMLAQARIDALRFAMESPSRRGWPSPMHESLDGAHAVISAQLHKEAHEAHQRLLMFALMDGGAEALASAAVVIRERYFRRDEAVRHTIHHYLERDIRYVPSMWNGAAEDSLGKAITASLERLIETGEIDPPLFRRPDTDEKVIDALGRRDVPPDLIEQLAAHLQPEEP